MPKIWREGQNHRTPYSLALHSIHHISIHMHFSIMIVWLAYSLGPIFNFVKYLRQVCLSFSPTLSSTKKRTKGLGEDTNTFEWMRVSFEELVFIFRKLLKTSGCNIEQRMGKWCSMKRSISQPPKTRRSPKSPMEIKVKRVSKVWPTYSIRDRMFCCNLCMMKKWSIAATPNQQPKV